MASRQEKSRCNTPGCTQFVLSHHLSCREHLFLASQYHFDPPQGANPCPGCKAMARSTYAETKQAFVYREATGAFTSRANLRAGAKTPQTAAGSKQAAFVDRLRANMAVATARAQKVDPLTHTGALGITDRHKGSVHTPRGDVRTGRSPRPPPQTITAPGSSPAGLEQQDSSVQASSTKQSGPAGPDVSVQAPGEGLPPTGSGPAGSEQEQETAASIHKPTPPAGGVRYGVSPTSPVGVNPDQGGNALQTSQIQSSSPGNLNTGLLSLHPNIDQRYAGNDDDGLSLEASDQDFSESEESGESSGESVPSQEEGESEQRSALTGRTAAGSTETWVAPDNQGSLSGIDLSQFTAGMSPTLMRTRLRSMVSQPEDVLAVEEMSTEELQEVMGTLEASIRIPNSPTTTPAALREGGNPDLGAVGSNTNSKGMPPPTGLPRKKRLRHKDVNCPISHCFKCAERSLAALRKEQDSAERLRQVQQFRRQSGMTPRVLDDSLFAPSPVQEDSETEELLGANARSNVSLRPGLLQSIIQRTVQRTMNNMNMAARGRYPPGPQFSDPVEMAAPQPPPGIPEDELMPPPGFQLPGYGDGFRPSVVDSLSTALGIPALGATTALPPARPGRSLDELSADLPEEKQRQYRDRLEQYASTMRGFMAEPMPNELRGQVTEVPSCWAEVEARAKPAPSAQLITMSPALHEDVPDLDEDKPVGLPITDDFKTQLATVAYAPKIEETSLMASQVRVPERDFRQCCRWSTKFASHEAKPLAMQLRNPQRKAPEALLQEHVNKAPKDKEVLKVLGDRIKSGASSVKCAAATNAAAAAGTQASLRQQFHLEAAGGTFRKFLSLMRKTIGDQKKEITDLRKTVLGWKGADLFSFADQALPMAMEVDRHIKEAQRMQGITFAAERYTHHASLAAADAAMRNVRKAVGETRAESLRMVLKLPPEQQQTQNLVTGTAAALPYSPTSLFGGRLQTALNLVERNQQSVQQLTTVANNAGLQVTIPGAKNTGKRQQEHQGGGKKKKRKRKNFRKPGGGQQPSTDASKPQGAQPNRQGKSSSGQRNRSRRKRSGSRRKDNQPNAGQQ